MPYYLYKCPEDGLFEIFQSIKDDNIKECPVCKSEVEKMVNIKFKSNPKESFEDFVKKIEEESDRIDKSRLEDDPDFAENVWGHDPKRSPNMGIKRYDPKKHKFTEKIIKKFKDVK